MDEIGNGLGLGEVDSAVEKCAPREFAWFGMPGPAGEDPGEDLPGDDRASVAADLDGVLAGEGARTAEHGQQDFVDGAGLIDDVTVKYRVGGGQRRGGVVAAGRAEAGVSDRECGLAGDPDHSQPARTGRCCDRGDGVRWMHGGRSVSAGPGFGVDSFEEKASLLIGTAVQVMQQVGIRVGWKRPGKAGEFGQDGEDVTPAGGGGVEVPELFEDGAFRFGHGEWLAASRRMVIRNLCQSRRVARSEPGGLRCTGDVSRVLQSGMVVRPDDLVWRAGTALRGCG